MNDQIGDARVFVKKTLIAILGMMGIACVANASVDTFDTYVSGSSLVGQGGWLTYSNYYGGLWGTDSIVYLGGGIGGANGGTSAGGLGDEPTDQAAVKAVDNGDIGPGGDLIVRALTSRGQFNWNVSLVLGDAGVVNTSVPLNGNRIHFNSGGDATYQVGTTGGDTANPKITGLDFTSYGWIQVEAWVHATADPDGAGPLVGTVTVSWRDVDNTTGAPIAPWTELGTIGQSYGTPSYVGFFTTQGFIDNFEVIPVIPPVIPEPSCGALLAVGVGTLLLRRRPRA